MKDNRVTGIILRKTNYSDNDIIFDVLSESGEVVGFFARGARKLKSRFVGVLQLGHIVNITFSTGKNLNYPTEVTIDKKNLFSFYSKNMDAMNFYIDVITITKAIAKDLESEELFHYTVDSYQRAEKGEKLIDIYNDFLNNVLHLIGAETELRCFFSGETINESEFFYLPESNKIFSQKNKPKTINAELITSDSVFQKKYLQKLIYEHIHHKLNLKF
jgi:DNA repair protein RecO